jgi:endonuclease/exonuclease/phosphatase family metal-dependent hydrolase
VRLVSLNAWGGAVWPALEEWLPRCRADVLCLQEVTRAPVPSPDWLVYADAERRLDQRADLFADVGRLLPGHRGQFCAAARGPMQDAAGGIFASEHGIALFVAAPFTVTAQWQGFAHGAFRPDGWGAAPVPRALQAVRLYDPESGRHLVLCHLHGLRDPAGKGDTPARAAQAEAVLAAVAAVRCPGDPVVVAGDLNLLPGSESFAVFGRIGLADLVTGRGHADTRTSLYLKPQRHADYILVTPGLEVVDFDVPALPEVSDHRPLILDLRL